jgi:anti-sigma factor RsiW
VRFENEGFEGSIMNCLDKNKQGADILIDYLGGTLDPARSSDLQQHVRDCPDCRRLLEVWDRLDDWQAPAVAEDFDQRLYARIARESRLPWWRRALLPSASLSIWRPFWKPAIPLAAACAVLALAFLVRTPEPISTGEKVTHFDKADVEQVEQALDDLELLTPVGSQGAI